MASEINTRVTSGSLTAGQQATVASGFDTGFIFNNDSTNQVVLQHKDGSQYTLDPNEVYHFPYTGMPYEEIIFASAGACKYSFTSTSRISIVIA